MRAIIALVTLLLLSGSLVADEAPPSAADRLAAARQDGALVFLLVKDAATRKVGEMRAVATEARDRTAGSRVVELDRSRRDNRDLVTRYGLAGARLPIILIIASNGAPAGGVALAGNALERLLGLVPTPRKADTLLALFERKAVFVVVSRPGMAEAAAVLGTCRTAAAELMGEGPDEKAVIVQVSLDDVAEKSFLDLLGADRKTTQVATHVYGFSGKKTGVLKGVVTAADLVTAANKKAECCPGGKCG